MPWHDSARADESAEDRALRSEMRMLLGLPGDGPFFQAEPTPDMIQLAERLRSEANRRRHTSRQRPLWLLAAAALPFLVALGALGNWGLQHKRRADQLAAAQARPSTPERMRDHEKSTATPAETATLPMADPAAPRNVGRELPPSASPAQERLLAMNTPEARKPDTRHPKPSRTRRPGELVIPADPVNPERTLPAYQVKDTPR